MRASVPRSSRCWTARNLESCGSPSGISAPARCCKPGRPPAPASLCASTVAILAWLGTGRGTSAAAPKPGRSATGDRSQEPASALAARRARVGCAHRGRRDHDPDVEQPARGERCRADRRAVSHALAHRGPVRAAGKRAAQRDGQSRPPPRGAAGLRGLGAGLQHSRPAATLRGAGASAPARAAARGVHLPSGAANQRQLPGPAHRRAARSPVLAHGRPQPPGRTTALPGTPHQPAPSRSDPPEASTAEPCPSPPANESRSQKQPRAMSMPRPHVPTSQPLGSSHKQAHDPERGAS